MTSGIGQTIAKRTIFAGRNFDKGVNGSSVNTLATGEIANADNPVRMTAGGVQFGAAMADAATLDNRLGKTAKTAVDAMKSTSVGNKAFDILSDSDAAGALTNKLLIGASAVRVATAKDKEKATIHEGCAMGAMFGAETLMKTATAQKFLDKALSFIPDVQIGEVNTGLIKDVIKGVLFVAASVNSFNAGSKVGDKLNGVA